jgi:YHS domain-containing protein
MVRFLLLSILLTFVLRAVSVLVAGIIRGLQGQDGRGQARRGRSAQVPQQGVQMVRDPVCGTFVVRSRALSLSGAGGTTVYFCSRECRDKYHDRPASPASARSRTA